MSDYPLPILGGKTPLSAAQTPHMDKLAREGLLGRTRTVPDGFAPASDIANLSLLGYDPSLYYTGRGPLEAAQMEVPYGNEDVVFRCNLITETDGKLADYSASHISTKEADVIINELNRQFAEEPIRFYTGTSYRHIMVLNQGKSKNAEKWECTPPHDIIGKPYKKYLPSGKGAEYSISLMERSKAFLADLEVNKVRIDLKENPANMIWLWGQGVRPAMESFKEKFGKTGAVISAVNLIKGIGKIVGLQVLEVSGATGYYDTNYQGKAEAALRALEEVDFVFIHIEAPDEAGHNQDARMKILAIERIDKLVVGYIMEKMKGKPYRMLITPDHPTPISLRTHTNEPVPFLLYGPGVHKGTFVSYDEFEAQKSSLFIDKGHKLIEMFFNQQSVG